MTDPLVAKTYPKELEACRTLLARLDDLYQRNQEKIVLDSKRVATLAAVSLYAKARKQAEAIGLLASAGYGEDALILARSLVNLCIDLGFILSESEVIEERARAWVANGRV